MNKIITIIFLAIFIFTPIFVLASIDQNLYYGLKLNNGVRELQQFLIGKGFLTGNVTGNFYSLTLNAVKNYQASKKINNTGYVGPLTRQAINADLSLSQAVNPVVPATVIPATTPNTPLIGLLKLSKSTFYGEQKITAPQTKFKLSDFSLTNTTTEAINLKTIEVDLAMGVNLYTTNMYLTNLYVVYDDNTTVTFGTVSHINNFACDYILPVGQTINLSVYGDVSSLIPLNSTINSSILVSGVSEKSKTIINTNSNSVLAGQNIIFGTSSFTVSQDNTSSTAKTFVANQKIVAGKFKFTTVADSYNISDLKFIIPGLDATTLITDVTLVDTTTQSILVGPTKFVYSNNFNSNNNSILSIQANILVPMNSTRSITVYYNLANISGSGISNINIAPILIYTKAVDSRGVLIDGASANYSYIISKFYKGIMLPDAGVKASDVYIYKSIPTFTSNSSSGVVSNNSDADIYKFNISANPNGDVSIKQLTFKVKIADPNKSLPYLNNFKFFREEKDYSSSVAIGNILGVDFFDLKSSGGVGIGSVSNIIVTFTNEEIIPAGETKTYTLRAHINRFSNTTTLGANSVSTFIPADTDLLSGSSYLGVIQSNIHFGLTRTHSINSAISYNILWSDKAAIDHNDSSNFSSGDWYNGFGILNLPLTTQTVIATK